MKQLLKRVGVGFLIPLSSMWASFEMPDDGSAKKPGFPVTMRTGFVLDAQEEERQMLLQMREAHQKAFEKQLIAEMVARAPQVAPKKVEKFTRDMEEMSDSARALLPDYLAQIIDQRIYLLRSNNSGSLVYKSVSGARFLNDIWVLKGDESPFELSIYFGRVGFAIKDALMKNEGIKHMHALSALCFMMSAKNAQKYLDDMDEMSALSDGYLSAAQSYYWAGCLAGNPQTQDMLMSKAHVLWEKGASYIGSAPRETQLELAKTSESLSQKIASGQSYLRTKSIHPNIPSLYEWNAALSKIEIFTKGLANISHVLH
jgi:hypothetical protein